MLCKRCKKNQATVHVSKIVNNYKSDVYLCAECAKKENEIPFMNGNLFDFNIGDFLSGMMQSPENYSQPNVITCKNCGMELTEFSDHGRLGCAHCYDSFRNELLPLLKQIHGAVAHTGKIPNHASSTLKLKKQKEFLQQDLQDAIQNERYEDAAKIRDEIKKLTQLEKGDE